MLFCGPKIVVIAWCLCLLKLSAGAANAQTVNARDIFRQAFELSHKGENAAAVLLYEQGLASEKKDALAWQYYADTLLKADQRYSARRAYRKAAALHKDVAKKAVAHSRADAIKLSTYPGPECEAAVIAGIDPILLTKLLPIITDVIEVDYTFLEKSMGQEKLFSARTSRCGDIYRQTTYKEFPNIQYISIIGLPDVLISYLKGVSPDGKPLGTGGRKIIALSLITDEEKHIKSLSYDTTDVTFSLNGLLNTVKKSVCNLTDVGQTTEELFEERGDILIYQCTHSWDDKDKSSNVIFTKHFDSRYSIYRQVESKSRSGESVFNLVSLKELSPSTVK